jgi:hypothetical protein
MPQNIKKNIKSSSIGRNMLISIYGLSQEHLEISKPQLLATLQMEEQNGGSKGKTCCLASIGRNMLISMDSYRSIWKFKNYNY